MTISQKQPLPPRESRKSGWPTRSYVVLFTKGFCMGASDVVPGVSGGTMAVRGIRDFFFIWPPFPDSDVSARRQKWQGPGKDGSQITESATDNGIKRYDVFPVKQIFESYVKGPCFLKSKRAYDLLQKRGFFPNGIDHCQLD